MIDNNFLMVVGVATLGFQIVNMVLAVNLLRGQHTMSSTVSADIGTLTTEIAALHGAVTAATTGFATLAAQIAALEASGGLSPTDAAALHAAVTEIATDTAALASATPANDPVATPPVA